MEVNKYPWIVALIRSDKNKAFCAGTLVASKYVVTAAHCIHIEFLTEEQRKIAKVGGTYFFYDWNIYN